MTIATKTTLRPLGERIVVRPVQRNEKTASGLYLPENAKEKPQEAEVIAVGSGRLEEGRRIVPEVKVGDKVIYSKYSGTEIKLDGEEVLILRESDILAIYE